MMSHTGDSPYSNLKALTMKLTPKELEALAILAEECAEVIQIVNKIIRHGPLSYNPFDADKTPNHELLRREFTDVMAAWKLLGALPISDFKINAAVEKKLKFCHFQEKAPTMQIKIEEDTPSDLDINPILNLDGSYTYEPTRKQVIIEQIQKLQNELAEIGDA